MQRLYTLFTSAGQTPDYTSVLLKGILYTGRIFDALKRPLGGLPSVGIGSIDQSSDIWQSTDKQSSWKSGSVYDVIPQNGFTSIGFPYVGYYAMRKGWGITDGYLFMQSPRRSNGHLYPSNGSIELVWGGRHLIMQGGAPWYFTTDCPSDFLSEYSQFNSYFGDTSSFDRNTVIVDGMSQLKNNIITNLNGLPTLPYIWNSSNNFDIAQSSWDGGYGNASTTIADTSHDRKVIYVKDADCFIVTDIMSSQTTNHNYTQLWNFPPSLRKSNGDSIDLYGFGQSDIVLNENKKTVKTSQPNSPNLFIYQSYPNPLKYTEYYGYRPSQGQYYGWFSPDIVGARYPKPDVHVDFDGQYPLVSALVPTNGTTDPVSLLQQLSTGSVSGIYFKKGNYGISYYASKNTAAFNANNINTSATSFLSVSDNAGVRKGIVLNCTYMVVDGVNISLPVSNFEYYIDNSGIKLYSLSAPDTFAWNESGNLSSIYFAHNLSILNKSFSQAGMPLTETVPAGDIDCSVSIKNNSTSVASAKLIATIYNNNRIISVKVSNITLCAGETQRKTITVQSSKQGNLAKLFVLEDLQTLKPVYSEN